MLSFSVNYFSIFGLDLEACVKIYHREVIAYFLFSLYSELGVYPLSGMGLMPTPQAAAMLPSASLVIGQSPAAASGWGQPPPPTAAAAALQQQQSNMAQQLQKQQQQQHQYNKSAAAAVNQMKAMSGSQQFQVCMYSLLHNVYKLTLQSDCGRIFGSVSYLCTFSGVALQVAEVKSVGCQVSLPFLDLV